MSCFSLRLPPAKKAWKSLTSKLQTKLLHKLHNSKAIKKPKNRFNTTTAKANYKPYLFFDQHIQRKKHLVQPSHSLHFHHKRRNRLKKKSAPIYIDKLFKESAVSELVEHSCLPPSAKNIKVLDMGDVVPGTSMEGGEGVDKISVADDMWESVGLTSPQMHGIDERAEDFIVRFRAEMQIQEKMARCL